MKYKRIIYLDTTGMTLKEQRVLLEQCADPLFLCAYALLDALLTQGTAPVRKEPP